MKQFHHIRVISEMTGDLQMWLQFLKYPSAHCRPFLDLSMVIIADEIEFYMDSSKNPTLGFGGHCGDSYMQAKWDYDFMMDKDPSIQYLELFAPTAGVLAWLARCKNKRIIVFSDNNGVVSMVNNTSSSCKNCMYLIRQIVLHCLINNVRLYANMSGQNLTKLWTVCHTFSGLNLKSSPNTET